jgi:hypothetical protein
MQDQDCEIKIMTTSHYILFIKDNRFTCDLANSMTLKLTLFNKAKEYGDKPDSVVLHI